MTQNLGFQNQAPKEATAEKPKKRAAPKPKAEMRGLFIQVDSSDPESFAAAIKAIDAWLVR